MQIKRRQKPILVPAVEEDDCMISMGYEKYIQLLREYGYTPATGQVVHNPSFNRIQALLFADTSSIY